MIHEMLEAPSKTIQILLDKYLNSTHVQGLSQSTRDGYSFYYKTITEMKMSNGKTFGEMPFGIVTPGTIRTYLDIRVSQGVTTGANREVELLSAAYNWAYERDIATKNPCEGVRHNSEKPREKYIEDDEYEALLEVTEGKPLNIAAEITYLCRARGFEAWDITLDKIDDNKGIFIQRTKGSLPEWTTWTPRLRSVIDKALKLRKKTQSELKRKGKAVPLNNHLLISQDGLPFNKSSRSSAWRSAYAKLVKLGKASKDPDKRFTFHDIKAKGVSDHALNESGHKSEKAKAVYMRKVKEVEATK
ncbi:hypothetical protein EI16_00465 [Hydrogenovibrio marinus]|uniref:Tyr recombinase domain-containing protein n=2 Tax=Hydrogenovibrio marinus TaxID=28885 RepID=A0A066ZMU3_HYDMR|nr:hypothetical protein EI16_00465 [Hydrogenovibrio marinus]